MGKVGAFVGTYVFPIIQRNAPNEIRRGQDPFFVASSLCILSAAMTYFLLPPIGQVRTVLLLHLSGSAADPSVQQDTITEEDAKFRAYLEANGYDTSTMGNKEHQQRRATRGGVTSTA